MRIGNTWYSLLNVQKVTKYEPSSEVYKDKTGKGIMYSAIICITYNNGSFSNIEFTNYINEYDLKTDQEEIFSKIIEKLDRPFDF